MQFGCVGTYLSLSSRHSRTSVKGAIETFRKVHDDFPEGLHKSTMPLPKPIGARALHLLFQVSEKFTLVNANRIQCSDSIFPV